VADKDALLTAWFVGVSLGLAALVFAVARTLK
jgi:hypothetical protein